MDLQRFISFVSVTSSMLHIQCCLLKGKQQKLHRWHNSLFFVCVCVGACACMHACVRVCVILGWPCMVDRMFKSRRSVTNSHAHTDMREILDCFIWEHQLTPLCVDSAQVLWASLCFRFVLFEVCFNIAGSTTGVRLRAAGVVKWDAVGWTAALTADVRGLGDSDQCCSKLI